MMQQKLFIMCRLVVYILCATNMVYHYITNSTLNFGLMLLALVFIIYDAFDTIGGMQTIRKKEAEHE